MNTNAAIKLKSDIAQLSGGKIFLFSNRWDKDASHIDNCLQTVWNIAHIFEMEALPVRVNRQKRFLSTVIPAFTYLKGQLNFSITDADTYNLARAYLSFIETLFAESHFLRLCPPSELVSIQNSLIQNIKAYDLKIVTYPDEIIEFNPQNNTLLSPQSLLIMERQRRAFLNEAKTALLEFRSQIKKPRVFPLLDKLFHYLEYFSKPREKQKFETVYNLCVSREYENKNSLIKLPMGEPLQFFKNCIDQKIGEIESELATEDIKISPTEVRPISNVKTLSNLQIMYMEAKALELSNKEREKQAILKKIVIDIRTLKKMKNDLEETISQFEGRINASVGLTSTWTDIKQQVAVFNRVQTELNHYQALFGRLDLSFTDAIKMGVTDHHLVKKAAEENKILRQHDARLPARVSQIREDIQNLQMAFERRKREDLKTRFFPGDKKSSIFGKLLEKESIFSLSTLSKIFFWHTFRQAKKKAFVQKLSDDMKAYVENPVDIKRVKSTIENNRYLFLSQNNRKDTTSLEKAIHQLETSLLISQ